MMDDTYAYLVGQNVHYIYRHSIHNNFLYHADEYLLEWVDRSANAIFEINQTTIDNSMYEKWFYVINDFGIDIYWMEKVSPRLSCSAGSIWN